MPYSNSLHLSASRQFGLRAASAPISCSIKIAGSTWAGVHRTTGATWRSSGASKGQTVASFGDHGERRMKHEDIQNGGEDEVTVVETSTSSSAGGGKGAPRRRGGGETRSSSNRELHQAMDLTRRIKACLAWREVQALFEAEAGQYNEIHVSATVVAVRR